MVYQICAQTQHQLTSGEVAKWLRHSDQKFKVKAVHVYHYMVAGKPGTDPIEGFWWVATIDEHEAFVERSSVRVYEKITGSSGYTYKSRFFTTKIMKSWPHLGNFVQDEEHGGPLLLDGFGRQKIECPYTWEDTYEEIRGKEIREKPRKHHHSKNHHSKNHHSKKHHIIESDDESRDIQEPYTADLEQLDRLEEILIEALTTLKDVRARII